MSDLEKMCQLYFQDVGVSKPQAVRQCGKLMISVNEYLKQTILLIDDLEIAKRIIRNED